MAWPAWLWIGTPLKLKLWLGNRLATWTGMWYMWKRAHPGRRIWPWLLALNAVSLGVLVALFFWLHQRATLR